VQDSCAREYTNQRIVVTYAILRQYVMLTLEDEEWCGELLFTRYNAVLSERTGCNFSTRTWRGLIQWERDAWIESAKTLLEDASLPGSGIGSLDQSAVPR